MHPRSIFEPDPVASGNKPNEDLCGACQKMFDWDTTFRPHHPNAASFEKALLSRCPLCVRLWAALSKPAVLERTRCDVEPLVDAADDTRRMTFKAGSAERILTELMLLPFNELNAHLADVRLSHNTSADSALAFLFAKYKQCQENHLRCKPRFLDRGFIPKRVIDVGKLEQRWIRLCERKELSEGTLYVTLSHCWGGSQPLKLTEETVTLLRQGVPVLNLPKTFQDAVEVTRKLGLRYLWIDSLCIFQDNLDDWASEARCMRDIYSNAACCIAATASKDGSAGLFYERDPTALTPVKVEIIRSRPNSLSRLEGTYLVGRMSTVFHTIDLAPLNQRAWVIQERYLSSRIAHFTHETLHWECNEILANELYPDGLPTWAQRDRHQDTRPLKQLMNNYHQGFGLKPILTTKNERFPNVPAIEELLSETSLYDAWCSFRRSYTSCQMTREGDKLVALSGVAEDISEAFYNQSEALSAVAQDVAPALHNQLIAGMWRNHFLQELCWSTYVVQDDTQQSDRPTKWRAPTWSWASTNHVVVPSGTAVPELRRDCLLKNRYTLAELVDIHVDAKPSGELTQGSIRLRCRPTLAKLRVQGSRWRGDILFVEEMSAREIREPPRISVDMDDPSIDHVHGTLCDIYLVILLKCCGDDDNSVHLIEGIALDSSSARSNAFERVGKFFDWMGSAHCDWLLAKHEEAQSQIIEII